MLLLDLCRLWFCSLFLCFLVVFDFGLSGGYCSLFVLNCLVCYFACFGLAFACGVFVLELCLNCCCFVSLC